MDHLHEELKQPVTLNEDEEVDTNNSNEKTMMKYTRHCMTSAVDCDTSEPSDTDYETCDSGLSSESNSVTADVCPRADDRDDSMGRENSIEQLAAAAAVLSTFDVAAAESNCTVASSTDEEVSSQPTVVVGDGVPVDPCEETDCTTVQCRQKSEAGAGEVGTVLTEEPVAGVPACSDSDTTSLLSTSSDSKCIQDSDATSQTTESAVVADTQTSLSRKSSSRDRPPTETANKTARQLRPSEDMAQKTG